MKRKLPKLTKLANTFLVISVLIQIGYLGYTVYQGTQATASQDLFKVFLDVFGLEMYMLVGSVAAPILFVDLFSSQAKGKMAGVTTGFLLMLGILVYKNWSTIQDVISGQPLTQPILFGLGLGLVIPVIIIVSILTSCRPLAIIGAIGALAATVYNLNVIETLDLVMGQQAVTVIQISEILYGLGLSLGLIGIRKVGKAGNPIEGHPITCQNL
jgi:hypothetical protein